MAESNEEIILKIKEKLRDEVSEKAYKKFFVRGFYNAEIHGDILVWICKDEKTLEELANFYKPFILAACTSLNLKIDNIEIKAL